MQSSSSDAVHVVLRFIYSKTISVYSFSYVHCTHVNYFGTHTRAWISGKNPQDRSACSSKCLLDQQFFLQGQSQNEKKKKPKERIR